jgi:hypothetical protein
VVHQWLVLVDGEPAGFLLFDTNLARHIGVSHYVALNPLASRLVVEGLRCLDWLYRALVAQVQRDLGDQPAFGCVGEAADDRVRLFEWIGMHRLEVEYREPVTDHRWHGAETPTAAINLLWRPPLGADVDSMKPAAAQAGSAAFLLDHYGFDPEIPWVATAVGVQRALPGPLDR